MTASRQGLPAYVVAVTVVILVTLGVAFLVLLNIIAPILSIPVFLVPISVYMTFVGFKEPKGGDITPNYAYLLAWASVLLAVGSTWLVFIVSQNTVMAIMDILIIALVYVYIGWAKSRKTS